jgi:hypothetical protein
VKMILSRGKHIILEDVVEGEISGSYQVLEDTGNGFYKQDSDWRAASGCLSRQRVREGRIPCRL